MTIDNIANYNYLFIFLVLLALAYYLLLVDFKYKRYFGLAASYLGYLFLIQTRFGLEESIRLIISTIFFIAVIFLYKLGRTYIYSMALTLIVLILFYLAIDVRSIADNLTIYLFYTFLLAIFKDVKDEFFK